MLEPTATRVAAHSPYPMVDTMVGPMAVLDDGLLLVETWHRTAADLITRDLIAGSTPGATVLRGDGFLEAGVHRQSLREFMDAFAVNEHRALLGHQLLDRVPNLADAGITDAIVGGSYVSAKPHPGDLDVGILPKPGTRLSQEYLSLTDDATSHVSVHDARMFVRDAVVLGREPGQPYSLFLQGNNRIPGSGTAGVPVGTVHLPLEGADVDAARALLDERFGPRDALTFVEPVTEARPGLFQRLLGALSKA